MRCFFRKWVGEKLLILLDWCFLLLLIFHLGGNNLFPRKDNRDARPIFIYELYNLYAQQTLFFRRNTADLLFISQKEKSTDRELNVKGREIMCSRKSNHIIMDRSKVLCLMQRLQKWQILGDNNISTNKWIPPLRSFIYYLDYTFDPCSWVEIYSLFVP